jgi:hypothetical protein
MAPQASNLGGPEMAPQTGNLGGPEMAPQTPQAVAGRPPRSGPRDGYVLAVVKDLFFVARIRETARLAEVPLIFARSLEEVEAKLSVRPRFVLLDLTAEFDYERLFRALAGTAVPVLAFTTHALARQTQPWHGRCARVVTKETLTAELSILLREGVPA